MALTAWPKLPLEMLPCDCGGAEELRVVHQVEGFARNSNVLLLLTWA
jgi:hypothetical protein